MRPISTEGYEKPASFEAGAVPMLQWVPIANLVVDPSYQRPIVGRGRTNVARIAASFSWSCFTPVIVAPVEGGKFVIIDGQHRTTAAAVVGFEIVPCQIVIVPREQQAAAFKAINGVTTPISSVALHFAAVVSGDPAAARVADICARAQVELLRYPIAANRQQAGQTLAVGAINACLKHFGEETLITALQCITRSANNVPGALSALTIKALCTALHDRPEWRDLAETLFRVFDSIDLSELRQRAAVDSASKGLGPVQALAEAIQTALRDRLFDAPLSGADEIDDPDGRGDIETWDAGEANSLPVHPPLKRRA